MNLTVKTPPSGIPAPPRPALCGCFPQVRQEAADPSHVQDQSPKPGKRSPRRWSVHGLPRLEPGPGTPSRGRSEGRGACAPRGRPRPEPAGPAQCGEVARRIGRRWPRGLLPDTRYKVGPRLAPDFSLLSRGEGSGLQVSCTPRSRELPLLNFLVKAQIGAKMLRTWGEFCRGWGLLLPSIAPLRLLGIPQFLPSSALSLPPVLLLPPWSQGEAGKG